VFQKEFDRQVENLLQKGYPGLVGVRPEEFTNSLQPLRKILDAGLQVRTEPEKELREGHVPFVIVLKSDGGALDKAMERVERNGKTGFTVLEADDLKRFQPIESVCIPGGLAYLAVDIDTGKETLNVTPESALAILHQENRSPLTIEEGIALVTHFPEVLKKNHCFSLPGSRCGDRRVAAIWLSEGRPKLGWCWAGNPHTWLGSASCESRLSSP
jgi:hypothetical protein